jgi:ATP-dependent protease ClpP protease subunit
MERDCWMSLAEATRFGIIDEVAPVHPAKADPGRSPEATSEI